MPAKVSESVRATVDRRVGEAGRAGEPVGRGDVAADGERRQARPGRRGRAPKISDDAARRWRRPRPARARRRSGPWSETSTAGRSNIRLASDGADHAADAAARRGRPRPAGWSRRRSTRSTRVTTGLKWPPETGPKARISATRPAPVASAFSSSCRPTSCGDSRWAAMPEPTTAVTRPGRAEELGQRLPGQRALTRGVSGVGVEEVGEGGQRGRTDRVVDPDAALVPVEQAGLVQHLQVVADRRPGRGRRRR